MRSANTIPDARFSVCLELEEREFELLVPEHEGEFCRTRACAFLRSPAWQVALCGLATRKALPVSMIAWRDRARGEDQGHARPRRRRRRNTGLHPGRWRQQCWLCRRLVNAGLVDLHTASGAPHIVPPGATRLALGTNPIAFGFPSADGPVIFDIGTASLMWGEVLLVAETGQRRCQVKQPQREIS